jgi:phage gp36-like protein
MPYCSQQQIEAEIGGPDLIALTDDNNLQTVDLNVLNTLIDNVSKYIDGRCANIYDVPFNPVPPIISQMCVSVVCYRLYRRRLTPDEKNNFYDEWMEAKEYLDAVNIGEKHIDLTQPRNFPQGAVVSRPTIYGSVSPFSSGVANSM